MTSLLLKKLQTTRRSMLLWTQDNCWVGAGIACALSWASLGLPITGQAADVSKKSSPATQKSTTVQKSTTAKKSGAGISWTARKIVRAQNQNNPFEDEFVPEEEVAGRARVTPVSASELLDAEQQATETPGVPAESAPEADFEQPPTAGDSAALQRLKERSAKERYEKLHQEWLKNRKSRLGQPVPMRPRTPAEEAVNEFEPGVEQEPSSQSPLLDLPSTPADASETLTPNVDLPAERSGTGNPLPGDFATERPVRAPRIEPGRVRLQSQPKIRSNVKSDEELNKLFQNDEGARLPPPVRNPAELPKISEIIPVPKARNPAPGRQIPEEDPKRYVRLGHLPFTGRVSPEFVYNWEATNFKHRPLYFEDAPLERYGHSLPEFLQPAVSIGRFAGQLAFMPYQMTIHPPCSDVSPLGWYAPGECVPYLLYPIPFNKKAAAVQAASILVPSYALP